MLPVAVVDADSWQLHVALMATGNWTTGQLDNCQNQDG
jgi:hypothetical protein